MLEEKFIEEVTKEIERIQEEMKFVESEYGNYIKEIQCMHKATKEFICIEEHRRYYS